MRVRTHIIAAFSLWAGIWFFTKSFSAGFLCFISAVLIDFDHIVDYVIHHGWEGISLKKVWLACEQTSRQEGEYKFSRLFLILHSFEIAILLWGVVLYTQNLYLFALSLGYSIHILLDGIGNPLLPHSYFIFWRMKKNFNIDKLIDRRV